MVQCFLESLGSTKKIILFSSLIISIQATVILGVFCTVFAPSVQDYMLSKMTFQSLVSLAMTRGVSTKEQACS